VVLFSCETRATVDHGWMVHVNLGSIWPRWVKEKSAQAFIVFHYLGLIIFLSFYVFRNTNKSFHLSQ
jgi:hypothetical protein